MAIEFLTMLLLVMKASNFHVLCHWFEVNVSYSTLGGTPTQSLFLWGGVGGGGGKVKVVFQLALFEWN